MNHKEIEPLNGKANKLIVMMHGVGSNGTDLISLAPYMQEDLPDCYFFSPDAIEPYDMAPFGRQWFSLQDRTSSLMEKLAAESAPLALELIKNKQKELGLTNKDTIIFGFSQGAMMGSYLTLIADEPFAAIIGFSGRLILPRKLINTKTPFCIIHGEDDAVVPVNESYNAIKYLKEHNIKNDSLMVSNLNHSIDVSGLNFAISFIKKYCY